MKINDINIHKLKVLKVSSSCIIVENLNNDKGAIFISEVSHSYIVDLPKMYKKGDVVYGYLIKESDNKRYYSLKIGHTSDSKYVNEVGGGNLGLIYMINKLERKDK